MRDNKRFNRVMRKGLLNIESDHQKLLPFPPVTRFVHRGSLTISNYGYSKGWYRRINLKYNRLKKSQASSRIIDDEGERSYG